MDTGKSARIAFLSALNDEELAEYEDLIKAEQQKRAAAQAGAEAVAEPEASAAVEVPASAETSLPDRPGDPASPCFCYSADDEAKYWRRLHGKGEFADGSTMRLLRQDALSKRWVCYMLDANTSGKKPRQYAGKDESAEKDMAHAQPTHIAKCPFCIGNEADTEVLRIWPNGELIEREGLPEDAADKDKWLVRVLRNPFPYLLTPPELYTRPFPGDKLKHAACFGEHSNALANPDAEDPMYRMVHGFGASEVVVESPVHNALLGISTDEQVAHGLRALAARGRALRSCSRAFQLMFFKQYGADAGGSLFHPHYQVCSLPIVSEYLRRRLVEHRAFQREHSCPAVKKLYVDDVSGENLLATSRLVRQTEYFVASVPFAQVARGRIVIAPKRQCLRFEDSTEEELADLGSLLRLLMATIYRLRDDPSYNLFWETAPTEHGLAALAQQGAIDPCDLEKSFCWTLHIRVPNRGSGFGLASGVEVTRQLPEQEAREMRAALLQEVASPLRTELLGIAPKQRLTTLELEAKLEFPAALGPFMMTRVDLTQAFNAFHHRRKLPRPDVDASSEVFEIGFDLHLAGLGDGDLICRCSPIHAVTLEAAEKAAAGIPQDAATVGWVYPVKQAGFLRSHQSSAGNFVMRGGFVYFDERWEVMGITCISPAKLGTGLSFGSPSPLQMDIAESLTSQGRFSPITLEHLAEKGATHYAWIRPSEFGDCVIATHGAFAYKFAADPPIYFPVAKQPSLN